MCDFGAGGDIDLIWQRDKWESLVKFTGDPEGLVLVDNIRAGLHDADVRVGTIIEMFETGQFDDPDQRMAKATREKFIHLLKTLNNLWDLLAKLIFRVYELTDENIDPKIDYILSVRKYFKELQKKDLIVAEHLLIFSGTEVYRLVAGDSNLFLNVLTKIFRFYFNFNLRSKGRQYYLGRDEANGRGDFHNLSDILKNPEGVVRAHREAICRAGKMVFNHLSYEPLLAHYFPEYPPSGE